MRQRAFLGTVLFCLIASTVACGKDDGAPTPAATETGAGSTGTATTEPSATPHGDGSMVATAKPLHLVDAIAFPRDLVMYARDASYEGPSPALRRYYRDAAGSVVVDDLLLTTQGTPTDVSTYRALVGVVGRYGGGDLAAAMCHGSCYGRAEPTSILRSRDGGVTWNELTVLGQGWWGAVVAVGDDGVVVLDGGSDPSSYGVIDDSGAKHGYAIASGLAVSWENVVSASIAGKPLSVARSMNGKQIIRLDDGSVFATIPPEAREPVAPIRLVEHRGVAEISVSWEGADGRVYLGFLSAGSDRFSAVYTTAPGDSSRLEVSSWLTDTVALARIHVANSRYSPGSADTGVYVPVLIDFSAGTIAPIAEFLHFLETKAGGPVPVAALVGPTLRVKADGDCLNVRTAASTSAPTVGCYRDGVLLHDLGDAVSGDGVPWRHVETPSGQQGYASTQFLR